MNSCDLVATISAIACAISKCCSDKEIAVIISALTQLSAALNTILVQNQARKGNVEVDPFL
jgi:hypothetical protein